jgi:hypothetical protein
MCLGASFTALYTILHIFLMAIVGVTKDVYGSNHYLFSFII